MMKRNAAIFNAFICLLSCLISQTTVANDCRRAEHIRQMAATSTDKYISGAERISNNEPTGDHFVTTIQSTTTSPVSAENYKADASMGKKDTTVDLKQCNQSIAINTKKSEPNPL